MATFVGALSNRPVRVDISYNKNTGDLQGKVVYDDFLENANQDQNDKADKRTIEKTKGDERVHKQFDSNSWRQFLGTLIAGSAAALGASYALPWLWNVPGVASTTTEALNLTGIVHGGKLLLGENGLKKSWNLYKNGDYEGMGYSLFGDVVSGLEMIPGIFSFHSQLKPWSYRIPLRDNEAYRLGTKEMIDDAERLGLIRANPKSYLFKLHKDWAGVSFTKGRLYNPRDRQSTVVIVGDMNKMEYVPKVQGGHTTIQEFNLPLSRTGKMDIGTEVTPISNNLTNNAPISNFYYYERGSNPISKYFWKRKQFRNLNDFSSELDWNASSWFGKRTNPNYDTEDIEVLSNHIPEYLQIEKSAKSNGTWLKNPDDSFWKDDPRTWVLIQSQDFKNWFGDSKVIESQTPSIVIHGSDSRFNKFDISKFGKTDDGDYGVGHYFSNVRRNPDGSLYHNNYYGEWNYGKNKYPVFLKIENPAYLVSNTGTLPTYQFNRVGYDLSLFMGKDGVILYSPELTTNPVFRALNLFVVPNSTLIKAALGNNGAFGINLENIYK